MPLEEWHEQAPAAAAAEAAIAHLETDPNYVRIDKLFSAHMAGHAIFDSLGAKTNAIHTYRIYCTRDGRETVAVATLMPGSDGHPGIVHGGVTALLFDNTLGWMNAVARLAASGDLQATLDGKPVSDDTAATFGFTAFLHTNYRAPCKVGSTLVLVCSVERAEGRKLYVQGKARDSATGQLIADSNALFVRPRGPASS